MSWNIEIADAAYQDLRDIYVYIAVELRSPEDADTDGMFASGWDA